MKMNNYSLGITINGIDQSFEDTYGMTEQQMFDRLHDGILELKNIVEEAMYIIEEIREDQGDDVANILLENLKYETQDKIQEINEILDSLRPK